MGFLQRLIQPDVRAEVLSTSYELDQYLRQFGLGAESIAGVRITPESAMSQITVFTCVRILAESVAMLPLGVLERNKTDRRISTAAFDDDIYKLLHDQPNPYQTSYEFREMLQGHAGLRGNGFALVNRLGSGRVAELLPLHPDRITVEVDERWRRTYIYRNTKNGHDKFDAKDILHIKGLSDDGVLGMSAVKMARNAIGLGLAAEQHGSRTFSGGARPAGVLSHPEHLSKEAADRIGGDFDAAHNGINSQRTMVLEEGLEWKQIALSNDDAQFLETRKFQRSEIASWFRIPDHMVNGTDKPFQSNIEEQQRGFIVNTLMPWLTKWEQAINHTLLATINPDYFAKFAVQGFMRGDHKSRAEFYASGITNGWLNRNEVRDFEDLNPEEGLDEFMSPLNMREGNDGNEPDPTNE